MAEKVKPLIFLFEDDEIVSNLIIFRLEREGYEVKNFPDGQIAMASIMQDAPPNLVITDIFMPFNSGYTLIEAMRDQPTWAKIPILVLTSVNNEEHALRILRSGANEYINKPFRPVELVEHVRKLLKNAQTYPA